MKARIALLGLLLFQNQVSSAAEAAEPYEERGRTFLAYRGHSVFLAPGQALACVFREMETDEVIDRFPEKTPTPATPMSRISHSDASVSVEKPSDEMSSIT